MERSLALVGVIGIIIQSLFIYVEHKKNYVLALILKTTASLLFVFMGYKASALCSDTQTARLIVIGLSLGALGDFFLNLRFVFPKLGNVIFLVGIAVFLAGHIMYLIALIGLSHNVLVPAIAGVIIAALIICWIFSKIEAKLAFKIFGVFYLGAVTLMATYAVANFLSDTSSFNLLFAFGAVLFLISDIVLILNTFTKQTKFSLRICNLMLYYIGQLSIAFSMLYK